MRKAPSLVPIWHGAGVSQLTKAIVFSLTKSHVNAVLTAHDSGWEKGHYMRMTRALLLCAAATVGLSSAANATIDWSTNQALGQGQTVQLQNNQVVSPGDTLIGFTNQTNTQIDFQSLQTISTQAAGQALIFGTNQLLYNLTFYADNPLLGFGYLEFNLHYNGGGPSGGTASGVQLTGFDQFNTPFVESFDLGNGENFFSALASGGERITSVSFLTDDGGVTDFRQLRLNVVDQNGNALPEPSTWAMMLFGFGATGFALRWTRRKTKLISQLV